MPGSDCCFLTCIHISQETDKVAWYSHHFKNFPQLVIHTVKDFSIDNEVEVDVFLEFSCFFYASNNVGNLVSSYSAISKLAYKSGSSWFTYYQNLVWRILSITSLACEMREIV